MRIQMPGDSGITVLEAVLLMVLMAALVVLVTPHSILYPNQRRIGSKNACIANLKQIESAVQQWALENKKTAGSRVTTADITNYLKGGVMPSEPLGGSYAVTTIDANPTCSLSARLGHTL